MQKTLRPLVPILALAALLLALAGCGGASPKNIGPQAAAAMVESVDIYVAQYDGDPEMTALSVPGGVIYLQRVPVLTRADLTDAAAMVDSHGQSFVGLRFTDSGARKLASASIGNQGRMLALMVGHQLVTSPRITEPLDHGVLAFGVPTRQAALEISARIRGEQPAAPPMALPAAR